MPGFPSRSGSDAGILDGTPRPGPPAPRPASDLPFMNPTLLIALSVPCAAVDVRGEGTDERKVPESFRVVKPVPDDKLVRDVKPGVADHDVHLRGRGLAQHRAHLDRGGPPRPQVPDQPGQRQA